MIHPPTSVISISIAIALTDPQSGYSAEHDAVRLAAAYEGQVDVLSVVDVVTREGAVLVVEKGIDHEPDLDLAADRLRLELIKVWQRYARPASQ